MEKIEPKRNNPTDARIPFMWGRVMQKLDIFEKRAYREAGVCVATLTLRLPNEPAVERLYKRLAARYISEFERRAVPLMRREYLLSTDEKKRFTFKPLVFTVHYALTECDSIVAVEVEERLTRRGRVICKALHRDVFDKSLGILLPQRKRKKHS